MRHVNALTIFLGSLVLLTASVSQGQSLGDVAREQRQQKQAQGAAATPKTITNEDLPEHSESPSSDSGNDSPNNDSPGKDAPPPHSTKTAEQWKAAIQAQKASIASLQSHIARLSSSVRFAGPDCVYNCVQHNERQIQKQDEVERMQAQLEEQKKKLAEMQESARQDGFGNSVYEP